MVATSKPCSEFKKEGYILKRTALISYRGEKTQAAMARIYNVSQQAWAQWEQGITAPGVVIMRKIEKDSGIPMEEMFSDIFNND